jgi:hypothetical protein
LFATDQLHDVPERHVDDVDSLPVVLADGDDLVLGLQRVDPLGGATGDDLLDDGVAVLLGEGDPDALEGELHLDAELLEELGGEVTGVRVERLGECVEEGRVELGLLHLLRPSGAQLVAVDQPPPGLGQLGVGAEVVGDLEVGE